MRLSQDAIRRMVGSGNSVVGVGGGGGDISGATQAWVSQNFVSIEFFSKLFKAYDSAATPNEIKPNDTQSTITNIKAMFGFWTQQYISALGQNSGGGGGGTDLNEPLASINVAELGAPTTAGQVLTWNGTQWVYNIPGGGGGGGTGTVTSITAGTGLSGGTITTMGTIAINSTYQGYIAHGETAYGWGDHSQAGYATQTWVGQQGFALASNVYSKADADAKFMTIAAFENLFNAIASDGSTKVNHPYAANVASIKAMFGLWTDQYLSALGQNSGGGGGGTDLNEPLASINMAELGAPTEAGQVLTWNGSQWVYNIPGGGGGGGTGTVTSITAGTGLSGGTITTMGTISINSTYQGYIQHGETAYGWGNHASAGYATQTWVGQQGFALAGNVYSKADADAKFMTIAAFENLFNAIASDGSTKVNHPYAANVASIKAMFGLWTNQYLSALGLNSSGGGGGATSLVDLLDVSISNPSNGQALVYNSTTQKWENMNVSGGGGTVTQISTGTGLTGGPITTSGTISINSTYQSYIAHGETAYGWGDHRQAGYATPNSVANQMQNYAYISNGAIHIGNNSITPLTQHQVVDGTFWGQSWTNHGSVSGDINAGSNGGQITGFHSLELNNYGSLSDYGGFIDFHFNGSSSDYTSRIIEDASGRLFFDVSVGVRIGNALLSWDVDNNALKIQKIDGTAANFYATGGVSALGMSAGASSIDAMTFNYVTVNNQLKFGTNDDVTMYVDDMFYIDSNFDVSINGVEMFDNYVRANRLYLDSTRYLFISSGKLYLYDGNSNKEIAFTN